MRQLPPLNAVKTFEVVARHMSVTMAAEELCVSHSSVSKHIKTLEDYFGKKLFLREGRSVRGTPDSIRYFEEVRTLLDRLSVASEVFSARGQQKALRINATPSFALRWLIPKTAEFQMAHPTISLKISTSTSDAIQGLSGDYDLIFRRSHMAERDHHCLRILGDHQTPLLAPSLLKEHSIKEPADIAQLPVLHMRSRPKAWQKWFELHAPEYDGSLDGTIFDHFFLSFQAAATGHGVAIGSKSLVEEDIAEGRLVAPFPDLVLEEDGFHVLYRRDLRDEPIGKLFLNWLSQTTGMRI